MRRKLGRNDVAQPFRGVAGGLQPPRIGDEDIALTVDLHLCQGGCIGPGLRQKSVIDVFPDRQRQRVAGADVVGPDHPGGLKAGRKSEGGDFGCHLGDMAIDIDHDGIALGVCGALHDLALVRPRTGQAAGGNAQDKGQQGDGAKPQFCRRSHSKNSLVPHFALTLPCRFFRKSYRKPG